MTPNWPIPDPTPCEQCRLDGCSDCAKCRDCVPCKDTCPDTNCKICESTDCKDCINCATCPKCKDECMTPKPPKPDPIVCIKCLKEGCNCKECAGCKNCVKECEEVVPSPYPKLCEQCKQSKCVPKNICSRCPNCVNPDPSECDKCRNHKEGCEHKDCNRQKCPICKDE